MATEDQEDADKAALTNIRGEVTFEWEPLIAAGTDMVPTGRGTDIRLEQTDRVSAAERKHASRVRRGLVDEESEE